MSGTSVRAENPRAIVFFSPGFPEDETDTSCLPAVQSLVRATTERHAELAIHVVAFQYPFRRRTYIWHGATIHAIGGRNRRFPLRLYSWMRAALLLRRLNRWFDVRVIHSLWLSECTFVGSYLARWTKRKHVASILGQDALPENPYLRILDFGGITVTAGSEPAADAFLNSTSRRVNAVIPIGLDRKAIATADDRHPRDIDVLGVGSLTPVKRFDSFLQVVGNVAPNHPDLKVEIVGDGPERERLEEQVAGRGLGGMVRLAGKLPREDVLQKMRRSRILLHTATYEGQGYVFLEALASGMHLVCRDVGYAGDGEPVHRCRSEDEMAAAVTRLLNDPPQNEPVEVMDVQTSAERFSNLYGV